MRAFLAVLSDEVRSFVPWLLWATVSVAVSVSGPFGSYGSFNLVERALFWTPVIGLAIVIGSMIRALVYGTLQEGGTLRGMIGSAILNCIVLCPPLFLLVTAVFPPLVRGHSQLVEIVLLVSSISFGVCALRSGSAPPREAAVIVDATPSPPRLLRRIEAEVQGEIWAITVRDHYVDVLTDKGKSSLLMRFSDAIDEADGVPGAQVHRSHWVAWQGVRSVCREGGKVILHMKNGHQIPVSRNNRDKVDARFPSGPVAKVAAA